MGRIRAVRALCLLVALAACAWFIVGIRQAHDTASAQAIISGPPRPTSPQADRATSLLRAAAFMNPDTNLDLLRAQLAVDQGVPRQAVRILWSVVHEEPMNIRAWFLLASHPPNAATLLRAYREIALLMPRSR